MFWGNPSILPSRVKQSKKNARDSWAIIYWIFEKCWSHVSTATFPQSTTYANLFPSSPYPLPSPPHSTNTIHKHHVFWETITSGIILYITAYQTITSSIIPYITAYQTITSSIIPYITAYQTYPLQSSWTAWNFKMKPNRVSQNINI
jgi:hypothetical protein